MGHLAATCPEQGTGRVHSCVAAYVEFPRDRPDSAWPAKQRIFEKAGLKLSCQVTSIPKPKDFMLLSCAQKKGGELYQDTKNGCHTLMADFIEKDIPRGITIARFSFWNF